MPYMHILGEKVNVTCTAGVSDKGIPYLSRGLIVEQNETTYTVSVHVYPKTTTCLVFKEDDEGEWQGLYKTSTALYRNSAPVFIESILAAAANGEGMTRLWSGAQEHGIFGDDEFMGMGFGDWGDK